MPNEASKREGLRPSVVITAVTSVVLSLTQIGCSIRPQTPQNRLRTFVDAVNHVDFDHIASREAVFETVKKRLNFNVECGREFGERFCASSNRDDADQCLVRLDEPIRDDGRPDKFVLTFGCFPKLTVNWADALAAILGASSGVDEEGESAYVLKGGVLSVRQSANQVRYRSPALTGDPLDYREDKSMPRVPLDSRAVFYLKQNGVPPRGAVILVADFEKRPNPFGFPIQSEGLSAWLKEPSARDYGMNVLYLNPQKEGQDRMNGLILHFIAERDLDTAEMSELLRSLLIGLGFEDVETLLRALPLSKVPTADGGEVKRVGNFIVARDYEPERKTHFRWYTVSVIRRVVLSPELLSERRPETANSMNELNSGPDLGDYSETPIATADGPKRRDGKESDLIPAVPCSQLTEKSRIDAELFAGIWNNDVAQIRCLLSKGANPNEQDGLGNTALYFAVDNGRDAIAKILLDHGADPNGISTLSRITPLMVAASRGDTTATRLLLAKRANLNFQNKYGVTALMGAAAECREKIVELLLRNGADTTLKNDEGASAADLVGMPFRTCPTIKNLIRDHTSSSRSQ